MPQLTATASTIIKKEPKQGYLLRSDQKHNINKGISFEVKGHETAAEGHVKVELLKPFFGQVVWFFYAGHISIVGNVPKNEPKNEMDMEPVAISKKKTGRPMRLPGYPGVFYPSNPIISGGHFNWAEATKNGSRIPVDKETVDNIYRIAQYMEEVRDYLGGKPITVNSWYRDPASNRRVGGASRSRHLVGDAIDFVVAGMPPNEVNRKLEDWHGGQGGLASATVFTHLDLRGYKARWAYGF